MDGGEVDWREDGSLPVEHWGVIKSLEDMSWLTGGQRREAKDRLIKIVCPCTSQARAARSRGYGQESSQSSAENSGEAR